MQIVEITSPNIRESLTKMRIPNDFSADFRAKRKLHKSLKSPIIRTDWEHELEINSFLQNKYIRHVVEEYDQLENELNKKLPEVAAKSAIDICLDPDFSPLTCRTLPEKIENVIHSYRYINEEFSSELDKWFQLRQKNINKLQNLVKKFRFIKRTTSAISLITSAVDCVLIIGAVMHKYFSPMFVWTANGINVTGSVLALTYSKHAVEDIVKGIQEENNLIEDLLAVDSRGNAIDEAVVDLFPHGIDLDIITEMALDEDEIFIDERTWRQILAFAIILPNIMKDKKLIKNEKFLTSVKVFVESSAARMWYNRIKQHKLLNDMTSSLKNFDMKDITGNEVHSQAAINLYAIFLPMFVDSRNMEKMRFICSSIAAMAAFINMGQNDDDEFPEMRITSQYLQKNYKHVKKISDDLINEYD